MIVIKADTPTEMRDAIVKWLNYSATVKRTNARIARTKTFANEQNKAADVYEGAAKFIADITIETKS
jgi:hypothetical protein